MRALKLSSKIFAGFILLAANTVFAEPLTLKNLRSGDALSLFPDNDLATIVMVFQPSCRWCKQQAKSLADVHEHCASEINIQLIGSFANTRELKRELRFYDKSLPAAEASTRFARKVGGIQAAPTTFFFDEKGLLMGKQRGMMSDEQVKRAVSALAKKNCLT